MISFMYQQAQQQGKLGKYLASLGKLDTAHAADQDFLTPFKMGLQSGDFSALNSLWASSVAGTKGFGAKITGGVGSLLLPSASGMGTTTAQVAKGPTSVNVRTGDTVLQFHIHGGGDEHLVSLFEKRIIPSLKKHLTGGPTGLREAVTRAVLSTQGAY